MQSRKPLTIKGEGRLFYDAIHPESSPLIKAIATTIQTTI
jgi:hypothetical protein